jgi:hypothetical protein
MSVSCVSALESSPLVAWSPPSTTSTSKIVASPMMKDFVFADQILNDDDVDDINQFTPSGADNDDDQLPR